jgi:hypothetical protein
VGPRATRSRRDRVAHIIATTHNRDIWGQLPKPGERIVLGSGTLFTESYAGAPVIGVTPPTDAKLTG